VVRVAVERNGGCELVEDRAGGLGGRGLGIVTTLTSDWGVKAAGSETTVWAVLPVDTRQYA